MSNFNELASFLWSVADLLRGDYKQADYGKVILPFTLLRRLDCVLEPTKLGVLAELEAKKALGINLDTFLVKKAGQSFYNKSRFLNLKEVIADSAHVKSNLINYISEFSENARDIFERYEFFNHIERLDDSNLLFLVAQKFAAVDLHPSAVSNSDMGLVFEELIRRFAELSNETAGEHYTPREVIRLMVDLLLTPDDEALSKPGIVRRIYDPAAGTGGMLSIAGEYLETLNPQASLVMFGQELNPESYAICKADMLIKGQEVSNIIFGNTLSDDGHAGKDFDYMLSNPPFGVEWKKVEKFVRREHEQKGYAGRFGPGLPRVSDGSLLFLMHLLSKMQPADQGGSRIGIVLNGSPLFTGGAGSGESEIRKWIIENDWLEAIVAMPTDMFYNTGIATYIWMLTNKKAPERKGKLQLVNGTEFFRKMRKSLGSKRKELGPEDIERIVKLHGSFEENEYCKILDNEEFGYRTITVERPLKDENGRIVIGTKGKQKGKPMPDTGLRDTENVPLKEDIQTYFKREVLPHVPDAWIDHDKTKVGYEIPFNRYFYKYIPPRPLEEIDADLKAVSGEIMALLQEITE
ncbi:MAG: type I restriction-modification system subunit M [bacterium]